MLCLPKQGFVLLSMPKCASTSLVTALAPQASIVFQGNPSLKHMGCRGFDRHVRPILGRVGHPRRSYEVVSLFREPVAWLDSWHRYRSRPGLKQRGDTSYAGDLSFEEFAERYIAGEGQPGPAAHGPIVYGRPARFISLGEDMRVETDRLFALEAPEVWGAWIDEQMGGRVEIGQRNRSTVRSGPELSTSLRRRLEEHFSLEYDVYERLRGTGQWVGARGHVLQPPAG